MPEKTETEALVKVLSENIQVRVEQIGRPKSSEQVPYAAVHAGMSIKSLKPILDEYLTAPERRTGIAKADRIESFIALVNRFKDENSALFAHGQIDGKTIKAGLTAIIDYHIKSPQNTDARFCQHRVQYQFPVSKEFAAWIKHDSVGMDQTAFAAFLEDHIPDLVVATDDDAKQLERLSPQFATPIDILELSRGLEVRSQEVVKKAVKLQSGETEMLFSSQFTDGEGQALKVPNFFILGIPVFEGGAFHRLPVRLRFRVANQKVQWFYDLYRPQDIFDTAFNAACTLASTETDLPLFMGASEAG